MTKVYVLHHAHEFDDGSEDVKLIGIYSTERRAKAAIRRLVNQPGFRDLPEGFNVADYNLDEDNWTEGFVTIPPLTKKSRGRGSKRSK